MPSISPQGRASIGEQPQQPHRSTVKAQTGMNLPVNSGPNSAGTPQTGQTANQGETTAAVTLSPQLTALARKQQKLQAEIQAQREKEANWEKEKAGYISKDSFKAKAQQNAAEALSDLGYTYDEITNLLLTQSQGDDPVQSLRSEIDQLKKSQEENVNKQYDATIRQYKAETEALIAQKAKDFHFIKKGNHSDVVVEHIVETWKEDDSKVLTVEQAAKEVEEFLREDAKEKAAVLKELEAPEATAAPATKKTLPPPQTRTLTNQIETAPTRTFNQFQHLSPKERLAQAIARASR